MNHDEILIIKCEILLNEEYHRNELRENNIRDTPGFYKIYNNMLMLSRQMVANGILTKLEAKITFEQAINIYKKVCNEND